MPWPEPRRTAAFAVLLLLALQPAARAQESAAWERGRAGGVDFADLPLDSPGRLTLFCRQMSTGPLAGLSLTAPAFQTLVRNRQEYNLTIVVDGVRENFHLVARDIELWFEAKDLNQQTALARFFDTLPRARRIDLAISSLGWRESRQIANSDILAGLMDNCL
jgi:hypothetical protein